jgi:hypothetical protein
MLTLGGRHRAGRPTVRTADGAIDNGLADEWYHLTSIGAVRAPEGCTGDDWFVYRIARGSSAITGYRRGSLRHVSADVEILVAALNARREGRSTTESRMKRRTASKAAPKRH